MRHGTSVLSGVVLAVALAACEAAHAESYRYVRWIGRDVLTIEPSKARIVIGGDALFTTVFCGDSDPYFCFRSAANAFAVPRDVRADTKNWSAHGKNYELVKRDVSISVFGRKMEGLYLIRRAADASMPAHVFLYSPSQGLVAFGMEDLRTTYWLEGKTGFGALTPAE